MPAGRPRKPLNVLEMSGAVRKNPQRYRGRRAAARLKLPAIGEPPKEWLDGGASPTFAALIRIWREIVEQDVLRVLNISHRTLLKNTCLLQHKVERAAAGYGKASSGDFSEIGKNLARMGMTPVDSGKVAEAVRVPDRGGEAPRRTGTGGWSDFGGR